MSKKQFNDFYDAWWYLNETPIFMLSGNSFFTQSLSIEVKKVNPLTKKITRFDLLNIKTEVWLEAGEPIEEENGYVATYHNVNYDCGGDTFEEAIINMANLIYKYNVAK